MHQLMHGRRGTMTTSYSGDRNPPARFTQNEEHFGPIHKSAFFKPIELDEQIFVGRKPANVETIHSDRNSFDYRPPFENCSSSNILKCSTDKGGSVNGHRGFIKDQDRASIEGMESLNAHDKREKLTANRSDFPMGINYELFSKLTSLGLAFALEVDDLVVASKQSEQHCTQDY